MTFDSDQKSISDSAPVELYDFVTPQTTYYRTSYQEDYTFSSQLYTAIPQMRTDIRVASTGQIEDIFVEIPVSDDIVQDNILGVPPVLRTSLQVTVWRAQQNSGARVIWWQGPVRGVSLANRGRVARLRIPDGLEDQLRADLPRARAQRLCNHALYDSMCQVLESDHDHATTVATVDGFEIGVGSVDAAEDYVGGQVIFNNERRGIVKWDPAVPTTVVLDLPFRGLTVGASVTLLAGCDHRVQTCLAPFNNVVNFGGHPGLPLKNPHIMRRIWED